MNPFENDACWSVLDDYNIINDFDVSDLFLTSPRMESSGNWYDLNEIPEGSQARRHLEQSYGESITSVSFTGKGNIDVDSSNATAGILPKDDISAEKCLKRVRDREKTCFQTDQSKSCRERLRREKMNDRFAELRKFLNPERSAKIDKSTILQHAICAVYKLKSEHQKLKDRKKKLQDDAQNLKEEKNELKEEKLQLQTTKRKIEQQIKTTYVTPPEYMTMQAAVQPGHKGVVVTGYGGYPMWQWIPPAVLDISHDHVLRPPVA